VLHKEAEESEEMSSHIIIIHSPQVNWVLIPPSHIHNPTSKCLYRLKAWDSAKHESK